MLLPIIFIFFLLLENLLLPALIGPQEFLITPLFLLGMVAYGSDMKKRFIMASIFMLTAELFSKSEIGSFVLPFIVTVLIYIWLNRHLSMSSNLQENYSFSGVIIGSLLMILFLYLYSLFFIFFSSAYDLSVTVKEWQILLRSSFFPMSLWSLGLTFLFKYVLRSR